MRPLAAKLGRDMARTHRDVEAYLGALGKTYDTVAEGTYVLGGEAGKPPIAIRLAGPVAVFRVLIGEVPRASAEAQRALFQKMLEFNANELVYASYGLENNHMVLSAALELENLDLNELEAVLADIDLALARHVPALRDLSKKD